MLMPACPPCVPAASANAAALPLLPPPGEAEEDGYEDEYQLEDVDVTFADYVKPIAVANFRKAWEDMGEEGERADDYGLGQREGLQVGRQHCGLSVLSCSRSLLRHSAVD